MKFKSSDDDRRTFQKNEIHSNVIAADIRGNKLWHIT